MRKCFSYWKKILRHILLTKQWSHWQYSWITRYVKTKISDELLFLLNKLRRVHIAAAYCTAVLHLAAASSCPVWFFSVSGSRDSLRHCFITEKPIYMKLGTLTQITLHKPCTKFQTSSSTHLKNTTIWKRSCFFGPLDIYKLHVYIYIYLIWPVYM